MQQLYQTIEEIINTGHVGTPVFVRCTAQISPQQEDMNDVLARVLSMAFSWLRASPRKVYAQSGDSSRKITATVQCLGGQTAVVSVSAMSDTAPKVDIMMLGNRGALYHDGGALPPGFDMDAEPMPVPEWLVDALGQSLSAGTPAVIQEVTDFE